MAIDLTPVLKILPQFIISGIIAFIFYSEFKKPRKQKPKFFLAREVNPANNEINRDRTGNQVTAYKRDTPEKTLLQSPIGDAHIVFLTVNLWILLAFIMIPLTSLSRIMPSFTHPMGFVIYISLAAVFVLAFASTVVSRISMTRAKLIGLLLSGGVGAYLAFYLPFMQWVGDYVVILRWVIIYCTVAISLLGTYALSAVLKKRQATNVAVIGSYASYIMTAALLTMNVIQSAF